MKTNYILDINNNKFEICSEEVEVIEISKYDCKLLQCLANNEPNRISKIHEFTHSRSRYMLYASLALFESFGLQIDRINDVYRMKTKIWIT